MMTYDHLVVDGDNMLYRAYFKFGQFNSKAGEPSGIIFGLPYMLRGLLTKVKPMLSIQKHVPNAVFHHEYPIPVEIQSDNIPWDRPR